jgi:hypothetical protein
MLKTQEDYWKCSGLMGEGMKSVRREFKVYVYRWRRILEFV